jgi:hypothetical protein
MYTCVGCHAFLTHKIVFEKYKKRFAITPMMQKKK